MTLLIAGRGSFCTRFVPSQTGLMIDTWYLLWVGKWALLPVTVVNEGFRLGSLTEGGHTQGVHVRKLFLHRKNLIEVVCCSTPHFNIFQLTCHTKMWLAGYPFMKGISAPMVDWPSHNWIIGKEPPWNCLIRGHMWTCKPRKTLWNLFSTHGCWIESSGNFCWNFKVFVQKWHDL